MILDLRHIDDMHSDQLPAALTEMERLKQDLSDYYSFRAEQQEFVCREIIGAGTPYTQSIPPKLHG